MANQEHPRSSRRRYQSFVKDYHLQKLDEALDAASGKKPTEPALATPDGKKPRFRLLAKGKQRQYVADYLRWLRPHRYAIGFVFVLALITVAPR